MYNLKKIIYLAIVLFIFPTAPALSAGNIKVVIQPENAVNDGVKWSLREFPGTGPFESEVTCINLPAGTHTVHFEGAPGWRVPLDYRLEVEDDHTSTFTGTCYTDPIGDDPILANEYCVGFTKEFYVFELYELPEGAILDSHIDEAKYQAINLALSICNDMASPSSILFSIATSGANSFVETTANILQLFGVSDQAEIALLDKNGNRFSPPGESVIKGKAFLPVIYLRTNFSGDANRVQMNIYSDYEDNLFLDSYDEMFSLTTDPLLSNLKPYSLYILIPRTTFLVKEGDEWSFTQFSRGVDGMTISTRGDYKIELATQLTSPPLGPSEYFIHVIDGVNIVPILNLLLEEPGKVSTWYQDIDGDGFGNPFITIDAHFQPDGYVSNPSDCNDINKDIFPGATELCDGIDNQCNGDIGYGTIDEGCFEGLINGDFESDLDEWSASSSCGHNVAVTDIDGPGPLESSNAFYSRPGGNYGTSATLLSQALYLREGNRYLIAADIQAYFSYQYGDTEGGIMQMYINSVLIDEYLVGSIAAYERKYDQLSGTYTPDQSCEYTLKFRFYRPYQCASGTPIHYIDNITIATE